ncbi:spermidine synthase [Agromyces silvae]|uniref:spermidine synthase n=1 Tax=Agromyces silvae TaxID=3388266 RepID=UPI00280B970B|nr:fused MFS/spermidine synthase [Agromyces protaetiae]
MTEPRLELDGERVHARLLPGRGTNGGYSLIIDGTTQSHVNPDDPLDLQLPYVRDIATVLSSWKPADEPLSVLHLGAGGLTIPRYVAARWPSARQHIVELHRELFEFVLDALPLRDDVELTVEFDDARTAVERAARQQGGYDVAIVDVFSGSVAPATVGTVEFFTTLRGLLAPGALLIVNTLGGGDLELARRMAATLAVEEGELAVIVSRPVLVGGAPGNLVLVASDGPLPLEATVAALAGEPRQVEVLTGDDLAAFAEGAQPRYDEAAS